MPITGIRAVAARRCKCGYRSEKRLFQRARAERGRRAVAGRTFSRSSGRSRKKRRPFCRSSRISRSRAVDRRAAARCDDTQPLLSRQAYAKRLRRLPRAKRRLAVRLAKISGDRLCGLRGRRFPRPCQAAGGPGHFRKSAARRSVLPQERHADQHDVFLVPAARWRNMRARSASQSARGSGKQCADAAYTACADQHIQSAASAGTPRALRLAESGLRAQRIIDHVDCRLESDGNSRPDRSRQASVFGEHAAPVWCLRAPPHRTGARLGHRKSAERPADGG